MPKEQLKIEDGYKWFKDQKYEDGKPKYIFDKVEDIPDDFNIEDGIKEFVNLNLESMPDKFKNNIDNSLFKSYEYKNINLSSYDSNVVKISIYTSLVINTLRLSKIKKKKKIRIENYKKNIIWYFNSYLYLKQLQHEEKYYKKNYEPELSKKILENSEITNNIINKYRSFHNNNNIVNKHNHIFIPKIETDINLNQIFGIFTLKIQKLLKNNNLNICISKKTFILKLRSWLFTGGIGKILSKYFILYNNNNSLFYIQNAILDINIDFKQLVNDLANCKDRYYFILGSQVPFGKKYKTKISHIIGISHKISLIFDKQKKRIYFYDPFKLKEYISDKYGNKINAYYLIFSYLFDAETTKIDYFKRNKYDICVFEDIETQNKEYKSFNLLIKEIQNIDNYWKGTKDSNLDWGGGYCGLWNLLLITMLNINPDKDIEDIFAFYQKLLNHENENKQIFLIKTLIRSFAYHIEQLLNGKKDTIPIVKLNVNSIDGDKLKFESINLEANKAVSEISNISIKEHDNSVKDEDRDKYKDIKDSDYKQKIIPFLSEFTKTLLKKGNPLKTESNPEIANYEERQDALHNKILFIL